MNNYIDFYYMSSENPYEYYDMIFNNNGYQLEDVYIPKKYFRILLTILFPPLGVFWTQMLAGFPDPTKIFITFVLTLIFYVPGLVYGLRNLEINDPTASVGYEIVSNTNADSDLNRYL